MARRRHRLRTVAVAGLLLAACATGDDQPTAAGPLSLTATPLSPSPTATQQMSPTPTATPEEPRDPTDADRARFIAAYRPPATSDHRNLAIDLDRDGVKEVVFAFVVDHQSRSQVDVAAWRGTSYEIVAAEAGGRADDLVDLQVRDLTADGDLEVVIIQRVGASGRSASVWRATTGGELTPLRAVGDCFHGSHTYGDTGVSIEDRGGDGRAEILATCEDPDRPQPLWPTVVYAWSDGAYHCQHRVTSDGEQVPCRDGGRGGGGVG